MLTIVQGDLLSANVEALVNTVNTVGVMGKGIALQIKQAFPEILHEYERAALHGELVLGKVQVVRTNRLENPKFIINFPTKKHWRARSRLQDIKYGLQDLRNVITQFGIRSVAVPPLGCGNGGLNWDDVRPLILDALRDVPAEIYVYEPIGAPSPESMRVGTSRPRLTPLRAALIKLFSDYAMPGYRLTMLEVQKIAYFWELAGKPTGLNFVAHHYGPYSEKLNFALQRMEGHYIRGYGDRSAEASIALVDGALDEAHDAYDENPKELDRVGRVAALIEGYETPYAMELLATVHWVMTHNPRAEQAVEEAIVGVQAWSERKKQLFNSDHIRKAWERLRATEWAV